jgi:cytochrome c oxidase subunit 4
MTGGENSKHAHGADEPHVTPLWQMFAVFGALIVLTFATVAAARVDMGSFNLLVALGIATAKALLVALYFMHLRYERSFLGFVFLAALFFVALFIGITMIDSLQYSKELIPGYAPGMQR